MENAYSSRVLPKFLVVTYYCKTQHVIPRFFFRKHAENTSISGAFTLLFIGFFSAFFSSAQHVRHWTVNDNVASDNVENVVQDQYGLLWFATSGGLSRFDGYNFLQFTTANLPGLRSNEVKEVLIDSKKRLWIGTTEKGICLLDLTSYKITAAYVKGTSSGLQSNKMASFHEDRLRTMWVSSHDGYVQQYVGNGKFRAIKNPFFSDGRFGTYPRITSDAEFVYIYSIERGIAQIEIKTGKVVANYGKELHPHSGKISNIPGIGIVFCAKEGAQLINPQKRTFSPIFEDVGAEMFATIKDQKGNYWFVRKDRKAIHYMGNGQQKELTSSLFKDADNVHVSNIFEGTSNNIWICTTNGIYKVTNNNVVFNSLLSTWDSPIYIPSFRGCMEDQQGRIFFGGYGGLFRYDLDGKITQLFDNSIPYTPYVLVDRNTEEFWALCEGYGVILVNKETGKVEQFKDNFSRIENYKGIYLTSGVQAEDGDFWLGSYDGVLRFDTKKKKYYTAPLVFEGQKIHEFKVRQFLKTKNNHIWICTNSGIFELNEKNIPIAHYHTKGKGNHWIPFDDINCIMEDSKEQIWMGSRTSGAYQLGSDKNKVITTNLRLADNSIAAIVEDNDHAIWFSTNNGLTKYNAEKNEISNYYLENGLASNEFNHGSFLKTRTGRLFFGGVNGISVFEPKEDKTNTNLAKQIYISKAELPAEGNVLKTLYSGQELIKGIELSYDKAFFYLEFFVPDYTRSESNTFEYFMEGYSGKWESLKNQNFLRFAGMAPGDYVLKIRGADANGTLIKGELVIPIHVSQVFYKTWWFILLNVLFLVALIGYLVYLRFKRQLVLSEMRVTLASDLHDDVGSALTKIAMQSEMLEEEVGDEQKAILHRMSADARLAMSSMRDMVWSIDARNMDIDSLFDKINEYAQKSIGELGIPYELSNDPALKNMRLTPIQKKEIYYLVKEAVNNALKHGDGQFIRIAFYKRAPNVVIEIHNTIGTSEPQSSSGSGLQNMQLRAARLGAHIEFKREKGFTVEMSLPLKKHL